MDRIPQMTVLPPLPSPEHRCKNCTGCDEVGATRCWQLQEKFKRAIGKELSVTLALPILTLVDIDNLRNWAIAYLAHQPADGTPADRFASMILSCCELAAKQLIQEQAQQLQAAMFKVLTSAELERGLQYKPEQAPAQDSEN